jgi:hypothetical protein
MSDAMTDREALGEVLARVGDDDWCHERVREWDTREQWEKDAYADDEPHSEREDVEWWNKRADAALAWFAARSQEVGGDNTEWVPGKWHDLTADTEKGDPVGDTIRLTWENGTVLIGRLTVPSYGAGHQQVCRMQTVFGGDTYVFPHGSKLEVRPALTPKEQNQ